jgi:hypothetical protein
MRVFVSGETVCAEQPAETSNKRITNGLLGKIRTAFEGKPELLIIACVMRDEH